MGIMLYNTRTRQKEPLQTLRPGRVGMYVCGVTVYDYCHIGHARVMVVFDVIVRHLRARGYEVTYVRNFTDIDDKIINRANELGVPFQELTARFIQAFQEDMSALGVAPADVEPRATDHLEQMLEIIRKLMDRGIAYQKEGDVYFAVDRFPHYGLLAGKDLADLQVGARVAVDGRKENPLDFALWKGAKPGEPHWSSPWGEGRPGWHIECSAMSSTYLGERFDIHGGGRDLIFPHHENEIAQSEGAFGCHPWVGCWLHNGFVNVVGESGESEKMSKSLGNFRTIRELLEHERGETLRAFILNSHYRSQLDFSFELLHAARSGLDRIYGALARARELLGELPAPAPLTAGGDEELDLEIQRFLAAMDDDFNTPQAMAVLFEVARQLQKGVDGGERDLVIRGAGVLRGLGALLGVGQEEPESWFQGGSPASEGLDAAAIEELIAQRNAARQARDFAAADRIREQLTHQGIVLLDGKDGTTWRRST